MRETVLLEKPSSWRVALQRVVALTVNPGTQDTLLLFAIEFVAAAYASRAEAVYLMPKSHSLRPARKDQHA